MHPAIDVRRGSLWAMKSSRLALHCKHGGHNVLHASVVQMLLCLRSWSYWKSFIRVQPGGADSGDISRRLEGRCTDPAVSDAPTPQLVYCVLFAYR
jgi:hypothetical protein